MKYKFNIPGKINVGFQNRGDTYTGKLAYVVYTDDKGVLRKERSWNGWRDKKIEAQEFENVPTEGFVLNKKVGDERWGWNPRKAWVRVYDPRDFEFEISVNNLVFILEECSSIKGKGLEGEFVYAWDGAELMLLPVSSQEYKESVAYKEACQNKVTKKDMKEGCCYLNKDGDEVMYLGRLPYWSQHRKDDKIEFKSQKKHIFVYVKKVDKYNKKTYFIQPGFTKIISKLGDEPSPAFPEEFEKYKKSKFGSGPKKLVATKQSSSWWDRLEFVEENGTFYRVQTIRGSYDYYSRKRSRDKTERTENPVQIIPGKSVTIPLDTETVDSISRKGNRVSLAIVNEAGKRIKVGDYYYD